jgi:decaprenyl-phosphate phosphoribosyltransferase
MKAYIRISRFDHWFKNIFVLPGFFISMILIESDEPSFGMWLNLLIGLIAIGFIASANYTINEYLDSDSDKYHPVKKNRPGVKGQLNRNYVFLQYIAYLVIGISISLTIHVRFTLILIIFMIMGLLYNVPPIRTKDKPYLDVLSESLNNPIRLFAGWVLVSPAYFPPSSLLLSYWFGGAFLMAVKRFSEYNSIVQTPEKLYKVKSFLLYCLIIVIIIFGLFYYDINSLESLIEPIKY